MSAAPGTHPNTYPARSMPKKKVAIICGGRSAEHHISLRSAASIYKEIDKKLFDPVLIKVSPDGFFDVIEHESDLNTVQPCRHKRVRDSFCEAVREASFDVAFIMLHGGYGEDGSIQGLFESLRIPYVGSNVLSSAVNLDKAVFKLVLKAANIPTASFTTIWRSDHEASPTKAVNSVIKTLGLPVMVKPSKLGSSIGISKASTRKELAVALVEGFRFDEKLLVERFVPGRELECGILGVGDDFEYLAIAEIVPKNEFYDFEAKYQEGLSDIIVPAKITKKQEKRVFEVAKDTCRATECDGFARIDMFLSGDEVLVNEVNTIPGFTATSVYPLQARAAGISYKKLITKIIMNAIRAKERRDQLNKETVSFIKGLR